MRFFGNNFDQGLQLGIDFDGDDVRARHHHIGDGLIAQFQDVLKQLAFIRVQGRFAVFGFFNDFFQLVASGFAVASTHPIKEGSHGRFFAPDPRGFFGLVRLHRFDFVVHRFFSTTSPL